MIHLQLEQRRYKNLQAGYHLQDKVGCLCNKPSFSHFYLCLKNNPLSRNKLKTCVAAALCNWLYAPKAGREWSSSGECCHLLLTLWWGFKLPSLSRKAANFFKSAEGCSSSFLLKKKIQVHGVCGIQKYCKNSEARLGFPSAE